MSIEKDTVKANIVRVYKNERAFPGLLLVKVHEGDVAAVKSNTHVIAMYDKNEALLGYNISNCTYSGKDGYLPMSEALLTYVNAALRSAGFDELHHDFTPRIVVGHVLGIEDHPNSDHLHICQVDVGKEILQIVCGAHNVDQDCYVPVALENAVMPDGKLITAGKLRGVISHGMLCSEWELGLIGEPQKGLLLLDESYQIGASFFAEREKHHV